MLTTTQQTQTDFSKQAQPRTHTRKISAWRPGSAPASSPSRFGCTRRGAVRRGAAASAATRQPAHGLIPHRCPAPAAATAAPSRQPLDTHREIERRAKKMRRPAPSLSRPWLCQPCPSATEVHLDRSSIVHRTVDLVVDLLQSKGIQSHTPLVQRHLVQRCKTMNVHREIHWALCTERIHNILKYL